MHRPIYIYNLLIIAANFLTINTYSAAILGIPPCPKLSDRVYMPDADKPKWTGCKDKAGLYQGILIQFSSQTEMIRAAGVKDSLRDGREIRFGLPGHVEERNFKGGHLDGKSFIFKTDARLSTFFPKPTTVTDWQTFTLNSADSAVKIWLKQEPESILEFKDGRLSRADFADKEFHFNITKDGRIFSLNHPEMKNLFFIDPEPLWVLNAHDLKLALLPGFGSCKKYSGPIGRFGRNVDHLLYKRETSEKAHLAAYEEMRERFIKFCVPTDLMDHLGTLECPPQLPTLTQAAHCAIPISDQWHIPYEPKYFNYEFTFGRAPDELAEIFREHGMSKFVSDYDAHEEIEKITDQLSIKVKRSPRGVLFRTLEKDTQGRIKVKKGETNDDKDWYEWHRAPAY